MLLVGWGRWLAAGSSSSSTRRLRAYWLGRFLAHLDGQVMGVWDVTAQDVAEWLSTIAAIETKRSARAAVSGFYAWAGAGDVAPEGTAVARRNPTLGLPALRAPRAVARPVPDPIISRSLDDADARTRIIVMLMALAGLRRGEVSRLRVVDVERDGHGDATLHVAGKGGRTRRVPIGDDLAATLLRHAGAAEFVVSSLWGGPLQPHTVGKIASSALPTGWSGHKLRHRFATRAYAAERDLLAVAELLGHSRAETTRGYVALPAEAVTTAAAAARRLAA